MKLKYPRRLIRLKIFSPLAIGIAASVFAITFQSVQTSKQTVFEASEKSLLLETQTIVGIFEREKSLKTEKVKENLRFFHDYFHSSTLKIQPQKNLEQIIDQNTGISIQSPLNYWFLSGKDISADFSAVDKIQEITHCTSTIFQKTDSGFVRISTNVRNSDDSRALYTYIPNSSEVVKSIEKGNSFFGRAFVVNDWYIAAYEPIFNKDKIIGMLYVGVKEKDLSEISKIIKNFKVEIPGDILIINNKREIVVQSSDSKNGSFNQQIFEMIQNQKNGSFRPTNQSPKNRQITAFSYFENFDLYVIATVDEDETASVMVKNIIIRSLILGVLIFILLSVFVYFFTTRKLISYIKEIADYNKKLIKTQADLEESEKKFRLLFENSGDEIYLVDFNGYFVEMNKLTCESLGYSKKELLKMRLHDIKTSFYRQEVNEILTTVREKGYYVYETEHISKSGTVISYEMKSRLFDFAGREAILSIARNITERKALEKKLVTAIIETEDKERKRFAGDLHDDLGPILSTAKLYSDLLKKGDFNKISITEIAQNIDELVDEAIKTTKQISKNIAPGNLQDFGLAAAVNDFIAFVQNSKSVEIELNTENYIREKHDIVETILYQSIKELINNTIKHSQASKITIELKNVNHLIILYYRDDGVGFDIDKMMREGAGMGLGNIANKIKTIRGKCDFNSEDGKGMFVMITIKDEI